MNPSIPYRNILLWLSAIFLLRVLLQFFLQFQSVDFLPGFDQWHSEALSYSSLLSAQVVIVVLLLVGSFFVSAKRSSYPRTGNLILVAGWIYMLLMLMRLLLGWVLSFSGGDYAWFDAVVPTAFHIGLAAWLIVFAHALGGEDAKRPIPLVRWASVLAYPAIIAIACLLFFRLVETGAPLMFSAYLSVLAGATAVLVHESLMPFRSDWRPQREEVINDGLFLVFVQVGLPALLKGLALFLLIWLAENEAFVLTGLWPVNAPVLLQVVLMLVIAEFFRYWIHRGAHHYRSLWKLHAVHHASSKLYTINVGRFHPLDKSLQFLGDTLPFLLLGISAEVFAAYFVFYAINGFYQHSNAEVKLGWLNWIIAGPELHRWHHSANIQEAKSNFGNNLIIWDSVFGTRYLPENKSLQRIGIGNRQWPNEFLPQLTAPFTTSTETTPRTQKD